jgi:hypothetical protein
VRTRAVYRLWGDWMADHLGGPSEAPVVPPDGVQPAASSGH